MGSDSCYVFLPASKDGAYAIANVDRTVDDDYMCGQSKLGSSCKKSEPRPPSHHIATKSQPSRPRRRPRSIHSISLLHPNPVHFQKEVWYHSQALCMPHNLEVLSLWGGPAREYEWPLPVQYIHS